MRRTWREAAKQRFRDYLKGVPGGAEGLRRRDPFPVAESGEEMAIKSAVLRICQAILEGSGSQEERSLLAVDCLIYYGVLFGDSETGERRARLFSHLRELNFDRMEGLRAILTAPEYDKLEAVYAVAEREGAGVTPETVLASLRTYKRTARGEKIVGDLPGLTHGRLRKPKSKPDGSQ